VKVGSHSAGPTAHFRQGRLLDRLVPLFYLLISFALRLPSFYWTSIDWDESLYFLMAKGLLHGDSLYLKVWENKPPGIYLVFALSQLAFGSTVFAARIAACIAVAITASLLHRFGRDVLASGEIGFVAGMLYVAYSVSNVGLAANTEVFFTPLVVLGFYLLLSEDAGTGRGQRRGGWLSLAIGLCLGCSLQIKYVTVFDLAGMLILVLILDWMRQRPGYPMGALRSASLILLGAALTFVPPAAWFWWTGHFSDYFYANFAANWIHSRDASITLSFMAQLMAGQFKANLLPWCAVILAPLFIAAYRKAYPRCVRDLGILGLWLAFGMVGVIFTRRVNLHNFLQVLPELCLIGSYITIAGVSAGGALDRGRRRFLIILILVLGMFRPLYDSTRASLAPILAQPEQAEKDVPALLASYLRGKIGRGETVYVVDGDPILYHLLDTEAPTRFVLPPYLIDEHFVKVAGIDPVAELEQIMRSKPRYVTVKDRDHDSPFYSRLREHLKSDYRPEAEIEGVFLYRRNETDP